MEIIISNNLIVRDPTPAIKAYCDDNLVLDNPDYFRLERLGKWTGNTPRSIYLYERNGGELWLPFGCLRKVWAIHPYKEDYRMAIKSVEALKYDGCVSLYPYQETAVQRLLKAKNGILVMPCGAGKTRCGLAAIQRIGGKALWLTHTGDLLKQSKDSAESLFEFAQGMVGTITGGKVDIGSRITFATIQTLAKLDLTKYRDTWDIIVVDEAQHCAGSPTRVTQFYKAVSQLSARYKIGLTATPKRSDGLQKSMFAILGDVVHTVTREEVAHTTCKVWLEQVDTGYFPDPDNILRGDGTIDYSKIIDDMIHDEPRYDCVLQKLIRLPRGEAVIVLANRVEYLDRLCYDYNESQAGKGVCLSGSFRNKGAKEERKNALKALNNGEIDAVFATYQLAKEGLDVPNLRFVVFATPEKDETTVIQSAGRVGRKAEGKLYGTVIDFVDDFGMYQGWFKKRCGYYRKIGIQGL